MISVKLPQPQFEGQTKGKLNSDVKGAVESFLNDRLTEFFEQNPPCGAKDCRKGTRRRTRPRSGA